MKYNKMSHQLKACKFLILSGLFFFMSFSGAAAKLGNKAGVHVLHPEEIEAAATLLGSTTSNDFRYLTIPFSLEDLKRKDEWQRFFDKAATLKIIPLVRLVTKFENGHWAIPTRKNITEQIAFLSKYNWPTAERYLIIYNEPNHALEFGGKINPKEYGEILTFASAWAKSEQKNYQILMAGLDLAAPNGPATMEALNFFTKMHESYPEIFDSIDYLNSHSYPNPGFINNPYQTAKNSVRGFEHELALIKKLSGRELQVFITETGWLNNGLTSRWLEKYYFYTAEEVWSSEKVKGVTPFLLKGDPGPFGAFSLIDRNNQPTRQYSAYQKVI